MNDSPATEPQVDLVVYDFGAVSVIYRIPESGDSSGLLVLSESLYENRQLLDDSRRRVEEVLKLIEAAISKANISGFVEDYVIFQIESFSDSTRIDELVTQHAQHLAQILRAEARELSNRRGSRCSVAPYLVRQRRYRPGRLERRTGGGQRSGRHFDDPRIRECRAARDATFWINGSTKPSGWRMTVFPTGNANGCHAHQSVRLTRRFAMAG